MRPVTRRAGTPFWRSARRQISSFPRFTWRVSGVVVGIGCIAFGVVCVLRARLGYDPWTALLVGLAQTLDVTVGRATQLLFAGLLIANYVLGRERPGVATVASVTIEGPFIDLFDWLLPAAPARLAVRCSLLGLGSIAMGFGIALYVAPGLGAGPPEGLVAAVRRRFGFRLLPARLLVDGTALVSGIALGATVGLGTVVVTGLLGPLVHVFSGWCQWAMPPVDSTRPGPARERADEHPRREETA
jgi:uncharacterized protein